MDLDKRICILLPLVDDPFIRFALQRRADEVTALLIQNEELRKQNTELVAELNRVMPDPEHNPLPF